MGLVAYAIDVLTTPYSSPVYSSTECHLDNADDPNVPRLNPIICFDFGD